MMLLGDLNQVSKQLRYLALAARRAGGIPLLSRRGIEPPDAGMQATGLRDYAPGDDYRYVDWRVCARRNEILSKTFGGDEDPHLYLLIDCSQSMGLGRPSKFALGRQIAAVLAYVALASHQRVRLTAFSGRIVADSAAIAGRVRIGKLLRFLQALALEDTPTDLAQAADRFVRRYQRPGPAVVISDLYDPAGFQRGLEILRHRGYEPRLVQVYQPGEAAPALRGEVELLDVESRTAQRVTLTERAVRQYRELFAQFLASIRRYCAGRGLQCAQISTGMTPEELLLKLLGISACAHALQGCRRRSASELFTMPSMTGS